MIRTTLAVLFVLATLACSPQSERDAARWATSQQGLACCIGPGCPANTACCGGPLGECPGPADAGTGDGSTGPGDAGCTCPAPSPSPSPSASPGASASPSTAAPAPVECACTSGCPAAGCGEGQQCCALGGAEPSCVAAEACGCTVPPSPIATPCPGSGFSSPMVTIPQIGGWGASVSFSCNSSSSADMQACTAELMGSFSGTIQTPMPAISEVAISGNVGGGCGMPAVCNTPPQLACDSDQMCCTLGGSAMGRVECGKSFDWSFAGGIVQVAAQLTAGADLTVGVEKTFGSSNDCVEQTCWNLQLGVDGTAAASASLCPPMYGCVATAGASVFARGEGIVNTCGGSSACGCVTVSVGQLSAGPWNYQGLEWRACAPAECGGGGGPEAGPPL